MLIGQIVYHSEVNPIGKWAELDYPYEFYPFWPKGSAGHVISRATAKFFSDTSRTLHRYQGEDTSIGIWLDEAQKNKTLEDVTYIHSKSMFASHGKHACMNPNAMIVGHDLLPYELLECHNYTRAFTEKAWLDDSSNFEGMIKQEMGTDAAESPMRKWRPAVGYKREIYKVPSGNDSRSTSFGLKGIPITMQ